jgi:MerR family transcriptional regulator/heat shock protein HspR
MLPRSNEPVFVISVAARLVEMHPQTLRKYEREGLIAPSRTTGNLRLYSDRDIERLRQVKYLVEERGLNLAGVQIALDMTQSLLDLRGRLTGIANGHDTAKNAEIASAVKHLDHSLKMLGYIALRDRS